MPHLLTDFKYSSTRFQSRFVLTRWCRPYKIYSNKSINSFRYFLLLFVCISKNSDVGASCKKKKKKCCFKSFDSSQGLIKQKMLTGNSCDLAPCVSSVSCSVCHIVVPELWVINRSVLLFIWESKSMLAAGISSLVTNLEVLIEIWSWADHLYVSMMSSILRELRVFLTSERSLGVPLTSGLQFDFLLAGQSRAGEGNKVWFELFFYCFQ